MKRKLIAVMLALANITYMITPSTSALNVSAASTNEVPSDDIVTDALTEPLAPTISSESIEENTEVPHQIECVADDYDPALNDRLNAYVETPAGSLSTGSEELNVISLDAPLHYIKTTTRTYDAPSTQELSLFQRAGSTYGFLDIDHLSNPDGRKQLYSDLTNMASDLWGDNNNTVSADGFYILREIDTSTYGLSLDEVLEVYYIFRHDNPIFFYLSSTIAHAGTTVYFLTDEQYANASIRKAYQEQIVPYLQSYESCVSDSPHTTALKVHDQLNNQLYYAYEADGTTPSNLPNDHNIIGAVADGKGVCEAYARTYELILNYYDVDTLLVTGKANGEDHAWNLVQLDNDSYYYVDCTWDDSLSSHQYFAKGATVFNADHTSNLPTATGGDYLYALPEVSGDNYLTNTSVSFEENGFSYEGDVYDGLVLKKYTGDDADVVVPAYAQDYAVMRVGAESFYSLDNLRSITFSDGIRVIDNSFAVLCSGLKTVSIPKTANVYYHSGTLNIGGWEVNDYYTVGFVDGCQNLENILLDSDNPYLKIVDGVLYNSNLTVLIKCPFSQSITDLDIPDSVEMLLSSCCAGNTYLNHVTLPDNLKRIEGSAFYGCTYLSCDLDFPDGMEYIGPTAFYWCKALAGELQFPDSLEMINTWAFDGCTQLTGNVIFPESLKAANDPFPGCVNLSGTLYIPSSLEAWGNGNGGEYFSEYCVSENNPVFCSDNGVLYSKDKRVLYACPRTQTELILPDNLEIIGKAACRYSTKLEGTLILPDTLKEICEDAFAYTNYSGALVLPDSLQTIGSYAFQQTPFTNVFLANVSYIGESAFANYHTNGYNDGQEEILFSGDDKAKVYYETYCTNTYAIDWVDAHCQDTVKLRHLKGGVQEAHPATCAQQGWTDYTCSVCGVSFQDDFIPTLPHSIVNHHCEVCGDDFIFRADVGENTFYLRNLEELYQFQLQDKRRPDLCLTLLDDLDSDEKLTIINDNVKLEIDGHNLNAKAFYIESDNVQISNSKDECSIGSIQNINSQNLILNNLHILDLSCAFASEYHDSFEIKNCTIDRFDFIGRDKSVISECNIGYFRARTLACADIDNCAVTTFYGENYQTPDGIKFQNTIINSLRCKENADLTMENYLLPGNAYYSQDDSRWLSLTETQVTSLSNVTATERKCDASTTEQEHSYHVVYHQDSDCTTNEVTLYECINCGYQYRDISPALGHDMEYGVCSRCHNQYMKVEVNDLTFYCLTFDEVYQQTYRYSNSPIKITFLHDVLSNGASFYQNSPIEIELNGFSAKAADPSVSNTINFYGKSVKVEDSIGGGYLNSNLYFSATVNATNLYNVYVNSIRNTKTSPISLNHCKLRTGQIQGNLTASDTTILETLHVYDYSNDGKVVSCTFQDSNCHDLSVSNVSLTIKNSQISYISQNGNFANVELQNCDVGRVSVSNGECDYINSTLESVTAGKTAQIDIDDCKIKWFYGQNTSTPNDVQIKNSQIYYMSLSSGLLPSYYLAPGYGYYHEETARWLTDNDFSPTPYNIEIKHNKHIYENGACKICGEEQELPEFKAHNLVLSGQIGVNFYVAVPTDFDVADTYVQFEINNREEQHSFTDAEQVIVNGIELYKFTCEVTSIEMADQIHASIVYGDNESVSEDYSVQTYIDKSATMGYDETTMELINSIANYGSYVQPFLAAVHNISSYDEMPSGYEISDDDVAAAKTALEAYKPILGENNSDVQNIGYQLNLRAQTTLNIMLLLPKEYNGSISAKLSDGTVLDVIKMSGTVYRVSIGDIPAHELGKAHTITITTDSGSYAITASALSYAYKEMNSPSNDYSETAMAALYRYYLATVDYRKTH